MLWARKLQSELFWFAAAAARLNGKIASDKNVERRGCCVKKREEKKTVSKPITSALIVTEL